MYDVEDAIVDQFIYVHVFVLGVTIELLTSGAALLDHLFQTIVVFGAKKADSICLTLLVGGALMIAMLNSFNPSDETRLRGICN